MNITIQGKVIDCYEKPIYTNKETGDITIEEKEVQKYQSNIGKDMEINCKLYSKSAISLTAV